ncbi:MAG TPA: sulfite exporter TauE/SafE family protein [Gaiellaceae bacterium]|jgi:hypothetical protein
MSIPEAIAIAAAGVGAGTINTVVGSGTLLTFPVLLAFGYSPVVANVSNTVGLVAGGVSGAHGYRAELAGQRRRALTFGAASMAGGIGGAALLLALPGSAFKAIVPFFIGLALLLVVLQPWLSKRLEGRSSTFGEHGAPWTLPAIFVVGLYGGYFGAAQGILLLAVLGISLTEPLQRVNGLKNVLGTIANGVAAIVFVAAAHVDWRVAALLAAGSIVGGQVGARVGRRLPPPALRALIVVVGIAAIVKLAV